MPKTDLTPYLGPAAAVIDLPALLRASMKALHARYPACYDFTLAWEGGYVNHPDDPGGCTNKGITIHTYRNFWDNPALTCNDLKEISDLEVAIIYGEGYWAPVWGSSLPVGLNLCVWDWGVNSGPSRSVRYLQQMVNSPADGIMGPNTLAATEAYVGAVGVEKAISDYSALRQAYYESLSTWPTFGTGWTNRNRACEKEATRLAQIGPWYPDIPTPPPPTIPSDLEDRVAELERWRKS